LEFVGHRFSPDDIGLQLSLVELDRKYSDMIHSFTLVHGSVRLIGSLGWFQMLWSTPGAALTFLGCIGDGSSNDTRDFTQSLHVSMLADALCIGTAAACF
jgi:hypothetical protein